MYSGSDKPLTFGSDQPGWSLPEGPSTWGSQNPAKMFCENLSDVMEPVSLRFHRLMCMLCWLRFYKTGFPPSSAAFVMHSKNKKWERERKGREPVNDYGAPSSVAALVPPGGRVKSARGQAHSNSTKKKEVRPQDSIGVK